MAIPKFQDVMLPILELTADRNVHSIKECVEFCERKYEMTEEEKFERTPSSKQRKIYNRVTWAITYLRKAMLLENANIRGSFNITDRGIELLSKRPLEINVAMLKEYDEIKQFTNQKKQEQTTPLLSIDEESTPEDNVSKLVKQINDRLAEELLTLISSNDPFFFERLVVELLEKMEYGGGEVTQATRDGGIDGIIKQDKLGLEQIYLQAKRWATDSTVGKPEIQKFVGALFEKGATKGVFITTGIFSEPAVKYADRMTKEKIILIDGNELVRLMIEYNVGVEIENTIYLKKVDRDYFIEE